MIEGERWIVVELEIGTVGSAVTGDDRAAVARERSPVAAARSAVARALLSLGGSAVQEVGHRMLTYVRAEDAPADLEGAVRDRLEDLPEATSWTLHLRHAEGRDWRQAWKRGLGPRRVGRRWLVAPSWSPVGDPGDARILRIDPGTAFGSGEHETTRSLLRLLEDAARAGDRVLDVGTGTGILAVGAARLGARRVVAVDRDPGAVEAARRTVRLNRARDRVHVVRLEATAELLRLLVPPAYDLVAANLSTDVLVPLLPGLRAALSAKGRLLVGGVLTEERDVVVAAARERGLEPIREDLDGGWWSGRFEPRAGGRTG